ncbi:hypothetical protein [uncultured Chitinophaga sp.]|uniref:hypothetical protein n=1 Tax=uncultured Chitinophaga sp. TaxID=339340 RepID=UPI0025D1A6BE|nr:hypothetical protein [uncultured Chitinophaga sp.]
MENGRYLTSFLEISVETDLNLSNLALLDNAAQGTYYHEYLHYIQDITTCSGLCKIWRAFDCLRQLISSIQPNDVIDVNAPMDNAVATEQKRHLDFLETLRGSGQIRGISIELADSYNIVEVLEEKNPLILDYYANSSATAIKLRLQSPLPETREKHFTFGENAVSETMAYLVERKFYPDLQALPRYPYKVATDLVHHLYPDLVACDEIIFSLCDASLLYNMPGWAFSQIIRRMAAQNIVPINGREVIDFAYSFYDEIEWNHNEYSRYAIQSIQFISDALYGHNYYTATKDLLQASVERGMLIRQENPYFLVDIFTQNQPLSPEFYMTFNFLGGPLSINNNGGRWVRVPLGMEALQDMADPSHFRVAWQLSKFLLEAERPCSLIRCCRSADNRNIDHRCEHSPWQRVNDENGCPYAAAWALYGFHKKDFYLNGVLIQQRSEDVLPE